MSKTDQGQYRTKRFCNYFNDSRFTDPGKDRNPAGPCFLALTPPHDKLWNQISASPPAKMLLNLIPIDRPGQIGHLPFAILNWSGNREASSSGRTGLHCVLIGKVNEHIQKRVVIFCFVGLRPECMKPKASKAAESSHLKAVLPTTSKQNYVWQAIAHFHTSCPALFAPYSPSCSRDVRQELKHTILPF